LNGRFLSSFWAFFLKKGQKKTFKSFVCVCRESGSLKLFIDPSFTEATHGESRDLDGMKATKFTLTNDTDIEMTASIYAASIFLPLTIFSFSSF
jgi:hypothetical protein